MPKSGFRVWALQVVFFIGAWHFAVGPSRLNSIVRPMRHPLEEPRGSCLLSCGKLRLRSSSFFFPTLGVGLLDFELSSRNSSPHPVYSSLIPGVPNAASAQPQSVPGVP